MLRVRAPIRSGLCEGGRWRATGAAATLALAEAVGRAARPGLILGLTGPLGAGKTTFVQGLACGLDVPADVPVTSPTFALVHRYVGRFTLVHVDAYRLAGPADLPAVDADDWLAGGGVVAVEWADRIAVALPEHTVWCELTHETAESRCITIRSWPPPPAAGARAAPVWPTHPGLERLPT